MKILVTGSEGFVAGETVKLLEANNHQVIRYDLMLNNDIKDIKQLEACVEAENPDRILHLAAIARFAEADKDPKLAFETNALGTLNVARVASKYHIGVVYMSTGSAMMPLDSYEPPFDDDIPARGNSVYGVSKAIGEYYIKECNPHIILRLAHAYGAEKRYHGLIGGFLSRIERGMAPILFGGKQTNSLVYIKDIAQACLKALTANWDVWNNTFNIGSPEELSAEEAAKIICEVFNYKGKIERKEGRTVDPSRFCINTKKAEIMLGFKTKYSFTEGLEDMKSEMELKVY